MSSTTRPFPGFRLKAALARTPRAASDLVEEAGGRPSRRWVVKTFPRASGVPLRGEFRADILDLASVVHPALALPVRFGESPGGECAGLLRPHVEGADLAAASHGAAPARILSWLFAAAQALAVLHRAGFQHGNLKPSNVLIPRSSLLARGSKKARAVLCDPAWWPEEDEGEARGQRSPAADLHALGTVFYRALTAREPHPDGSGFPPAPREINREVPVDLDRLVMKLLHPERGRGYQDAGPLVEDLERLAAGAARAALAVPEVFVGRREEMSRALERLPAGRGSAAEAAAAIAVTGEAGMGKSAFLRRLALEAQMLGFRTLAVRCYAENQEPFAPLRAMVQGLLRQGDAGRALRSRGAQLLVPGEGPAEEGGRRQFVRSLIAVLSAAVAAQPTLLLADEVHLADPLTIEALAFLVREIGAARRAGDAPAAASLPSLAVSYRIEPPFRAALAPLREALLQPLDGHRILELPALPPEAVEQWVEAATPAGEAGKEDSARLPGKPFAVRAAICRHGDPGPAPGASEDPAALHHAHLEALPPRARSILEALAVLGRPGTLDLLASILEDRAARLEPEIEALAQDGTLALEPAAGRAGKPQYFFQHGSFQLSVASGLTRGRRRVLHRRLAAALARRPGEAVEEIAHHWIESDQPRRGAAPALLAARRLTRNHEDRRALRYYAVLLGNTGSYTGARARGIAEEAAAAYARAGEHRRGAEILRRVLKGAVDPARRGRLQGRLGVYCHRSGHLEDAVRHLRRGLALLGRGKESLKERLEVQSELAEIAGNRGEYEEAERICARALDELDGGGRARPDREVRRAEMVLLETWGHLKLRRFQYGEARELLERSLKVSEELGSTREMGLILNNLGILHNQENRFAPAIACYQRAALVAREHGEDAALVHVHSNLALLHAKAGEPEAADDALRRAAEHDASLDSKRLRFLRLHAGGMVDLILGRYASAIEGFREAIVLGEELKDFFIVAFDEVYRGECHLYRGEFKAAGDALDRAASADLAAHGPVRAMAASRRAVLAALRGDAREARAACAACAPEPEGIPYIAAGNRVFRGWALRLLGDHDAAESELEPARAFFARTRAPGGEIQAVIELAALDAGRGRPERAERRLRRLCARFSPGRGALRNPMLAARLLACRTRLLLDREPPAWREAASCLVEAESYLIGRRLHDLEAEVRELRRRLRDAASGSWPRALPSEPPGDRGTHLELASALRGIREDLSRALAADVGPEKAGDLLRGLDAFAERLREAQRRIEGRDARSPPPVRTPAIAGRSPAIRKLVDLIRQVALTSLPVLISGETGTGKELVARAVHGESPRHPAPFIAVSCAAVPEELLEAELFGYARGAFTGADADHEGLLRAASGGTVLFDGVSETPPAVQAKLLRVLDSGRVRPVGGSEEVEIDVRYLFTTSRDLRALAEEGSFRRDLFFRVSAFHLDVPPLRERLEDLAELVAHFRALAASPAEAPVFTEGALRALASHAWPGNVRELENLVTRLVLTRSDRIEAGDIEKALGAVSGEGLFSPALLRARSLKELRTLIEKEYLVQFVADRGGDVKQAAAALGVSVFALYKRLRGLGVPRGGG